MQGKLPYSGSGQGFLFKRSRGRQDLPSRFTLTDDGTSLWLVPLSPFPKPMTVCGGEALSRSTLKAFVYPRMDGG